MSNYLINIHRHASSQNISNILSLIESKKDVKLLDLGCNDGSLTKRIADRICTAACGVDIIEERLIAAKKQGIYAIKSDLNNDFPFKSNSFDIIHANQVIEHLLDVDKFADEIYRILKPKGYVLISTENLSSWHNIFALSLGFQAFSQNISNKKRIGIPNQLDFSSNNNPLSWLHIKIFTYFGLKSFLSMHGFKIEKIRGAGYYPFPSLLSKCLSEIDPIHAHFITIKARKMKIETKG